MPEQHFRGVRKGGFVRGVGRKYRDTRNGEHVVWTNHMCQVMGVPKGTAVSFGHPPMRDVPLTPELEAELMRRHGYVQRV